MFIYYFYVVVVKTVIFRYDFLIGCLIKNQKHHYIDFINGYRLQIRGDYTGLPIGYLINNQPHIFPL